jgi:hypothetical protein
VKRGFRGQGSGGRNQVSVVGWIVVLVVVSGCSTPKPSTLDPEIKGLSDGANAAYHRGEVERADALYGKALQRARLSDNRVEISRNAYNLALCRMVAGKLDEARGLLNQAEALAGVKGQEAARIRLAESEVARLSGAADESGQLARQAVLAGADREGRVHALLLQSEAALVSGQVQGAREFHKAAKSAVSGKTPALIQARLEAVALGLVQAGVLAGDVGALQLSRADWLKQAGQFKDMVLALDGAAQHFEKMEKWAEAFDCRIRSAQSLLAAGNREAAMGSARRALNLAERSGLAGQKALAAAVLKELN